MTYQFRSTTVSRESGMFVFSAGKIDLASINPYNVALIKQTFPDGEVEKMGKITIDEIVNINDDRAALVVVRMELAEDFDQLVLFFIQIDSTGRRLVWKHLMSFDSRAVLSKLPNRFMKAFYRLSAERISVDGGHEDLIEVSFNLCWLVRPEIPTKAIVGPCCFFIDEREKVLIRRLPKVEEGEMEREVFFDAEIAA